jgi:hypothetical protein
MSHIKVGFNYNGIVLYNRLYSSLKPIDEKNIFNLKCNKCFLKKMFHQQNCSFVSVISVHYLSVCFISSVQVLPFILYLLAYYYHISWIPV